ncbi:MAG TPA: hypothetical protein VGP68_16055 [Gemmataceae bacterium]|nr:hypothetical protein [Gemmataceae bacterium]
MRKILTLTIFAANIFTGQAFAWNEKGHLVVCRLAWRQLTNQRRS